MNKRIKWIIILGIVLVIGIYVFLINPYAFYLDANVSNRMLSDPEGMTYMEYFQNIADEYNFKIDKVVSSKTRIMHLYSNDFSTLDDRAKLNFFAEFSSSEGSIYIYDKSGHLQIPSVMVIHSQGHEYEATIDKAYYGESHYGGISSVKKDGRIIFSLASEGTGSFIRPEGKYCNKCGGDGTTHDWTSDSANIRCTVCGGDGYIDPDD